MAAITLEELLKKVGVCREKINDGISDEHLLEISTFLTSWRTVAPFLKIESNDLEAIEQEKDEEVKRLKVLQKWKGIFGFTATYGKLVEVLLSRAKADIAEKVCDLLKGICLICASTHINRSKYGLKSRKNVGIGVHRYIAFYCLQH